MRKDEAAAGDPLEPVKQAIKDKRLGEARKRLASLRSGGLTVSPTDLDYMAAVVERLSGNHRTALEYLKKLVEIRPEFGRAYQESGYNYVAKRMPAEAVGAFRMAVEQNPVLATSWQMLVKIHGILGDERAADFARGKLEWLERLPKAVRLARDLFYEGKLAKAEGLCRDFLRKAPRDVEGMRLLAEIGIKLKIHDDPEFILESCVTFAPEHQGARLDYVKVLNRRGKFGRALEEAQKLVESGSESPAFALAKANALNGLGRFEEAIAIYEKWAGRLEDPSGVQVMLGHAHKAKGEIEEAVGCYRKAYRVRPGYGDAFWSLANSKTYRFTEDEVEAMFKWADSSGIGLDDRIHLKFALGKALEDGGDYEEAFAQYADGNALKMRLSGYRAETTTELVDRQIAELDAAFFARVGEVGHPAPDPIFIVGLPRAGSTLLEQILASHSMVEGTMELHTVLGLAQRLRGRSAEAAGRYPANLKTLTPDYFRRFGEQYMKETRVFRSGETPYFIDKMPNNFLHIGLIRLILPSAKVIDARRHPMACCFSGYKQLFGEGQDFSYSLETMGRYYRDYTRLMDHWDRVLPGFVHRVQHEDVINDLEGEVRRLLDFCGLSFEPSCLEFHKSRRAVRTPSAQQVRQPIYRSGMQQWQHFEPWLGPLKSALGADLLHAAQVDVPSGAG